MREIGEITTRINDAKNRREVEAALGRRDDAMNALRADRDALAASVVGNVLLGSIQEETRDAAMPIVFHRARELFSIITRGRYELEFDEGPPPAFLAHHAQDRGAVRAAGGGVLREHVLQQFLKFFARRIHDDEEDEDRS